MIFAGCARKNHASRERRRGFLSDLADFATVVFSVIFVNGGKPQGFFAPFTKIAPAERRRGELIANESRLQDGGLVFSNTLSYTPALQYACTQLEFMVC